MFQTTRHPVYFRGYCGGLVKISMQRGILWWIWWFMDGKMVTGWMYQHCRTLGIVNKNDDVENTCYNESWLIWQKWGYDKRYQWPAYIWIVFKMLNIMWICFGCGRMVVLPTTIGIWRVIMRVMPWGFWSCDHVESPMTIIRYHTLTHCIHQVLLTRRDVVDYLVGGWPTPLKNILVSWDDYSIPNIYIYMKSHKIPWFQSPPTRM